MNHLDSWEKHTGYLINREESIKWKPCGWCQAVAWMLSLFQFLLLSEGMEAQGWEPGTFYAHINTNACTAASLESVEQST